MGKTSDCSIGCQSTYDRFLCSEDQSLFPGVMSVCRSLNLKYKSSQKEWGSRVPLLCPTRVYLQRTRHSNVVSTPLGVLESFGVRNFTRFLSGQVGNGPSICDRNDMTCRLYWLETRFPSVVVVKGSGKGYVCKTFWIRSCFRQSSRRVFCTFLQSGKLLIEDRDWSCFPLILVESSTSFLLCLHCDEVLLFYLSFNPYLPFLSI